MLRRGLRLLQGSGGGSMAGGTLFDVSGNAIKNHEVLRSSEYKANDLLYTYDEDETGGHAKYHHYGGAGPGPAHEQMETYGGMLRMLSSPYSESFKDFETEPIRYIAREFGSKPKIGEPVPTREAATMLMVGKNKYISKKALEEEGDQDYKVLMLYREARKRFEKDQFLLPSHVVHLEDKNSDWLKTLERLGVPHDKIPPDFHLRICAIRSLLRTSSLLVIPPEGGGVAELEGPDFKNPWWQLVSEDPSHLRSILEILEVPYDSALKSLLPFRRLLTPTSEAFRFDNTSFITTFEKIPEVRYCIPVEGEKLIWVSPTEALKRFNAGVMELTTPTAFLFSEMQKNFPRYSDIKQKQEWDDAPKPILPEVVHNEKTMMATILFPGDIHHSSTELELAEKPVAAALEESSASSSSNVDEDTSTNNTTTSTPQENLCRFHYVKDDPYGVRAVFFNRPVEEGDDLQPLTATPDHLLTLEDQNEFQQYAALLPEAERAKGGQAALPDSAFGDSEAQELAVSAASSNKQSRILQAIAETPGGLVSQQLNSDLEITGGGANNTASLISTGFSFGAGAGKDLNSSRGGNERFSRNPSLVGPSTAASYPQVGATDDETAPRLGSGGDHRNEEAGGGDYGSDVMVASSRMDQKLKVALDPQAWDVPLEEPVDKKKRK